MPPPDAGGDDASSDADDDESAAAAARVPTDVGPRDSVGFAIVAGFAGVTVLGLWLSLRGPELPAVGPLGPSHVEGALAFASWFVGQLVLGVAFLQWFVVLHEAGHGVLFVGRRKNVVVGHVAGFITLIPFHAWQPIHQKHHIWAGWQDRDPTTMALVPRELAPFERAAINTCWRTGIPLFALLYRVNNFWNVRRLLTLLPQRRVQVRLLQNVVLMALCWLVLIVVVSPLVVLQGCGLALVVGFMLQEPIMLSQHTHIPLRLAGDAEVAPFTPAAQLPFTRSLRFPAWISTLVLLHFDAHELHHEHPNVPGWRLRALDRPTPNDKPAFAWMRAVRRIPADVFLFQNRDRSGLDV